MSLFYESPLGISSVEFSCALTVAPWGAASLTARRSRVPLEAVSPWPLCDLASLDEYLAEHPEHFFLLREWTGPEGIEEAFAEGDTRHCCPCRDRIVGNVTGFATPDIESLPNGSRFIIATAFIRNPSCRARWTDFGPAGSWESAPDAAWDLSMIERGKLPERRADGTITPGLCGDQFLRVTNGPFCRGGASFQWRHPLGMLYDLAASTEEEGGLGFVQPGFTQRPPYRLPIAATRPRGEEQTLVETVSSHLLAHGQEVTIRGVSGAPVNGILKVVEVLSSTTFALAVPSSQPGAGGTLDVAFAPGLGVTVTEAHDAADVFGYRFAFEAAELRERPVSPITLVESSMKAQGLQPLDARLSVEVRVGVKLPEGSFEVFVGDGSGPCSAACGMTASGSVSELRFADDEIAVLPATVAYAIS